MASHVNDAAALRFRPHVMLIPGLRQLFRRIRDQHSHNRCHVERLIDNFERQRFDVRLWGGFFEFRGRLVEQRHLFELERWRNGG
jgi:hypothetical protein